MFARCHFGTAATTRAYFTILYEDDRLPSWTEPEVNARTFVFSGSNPPRSETQIVSIGPCTVTWQMWFETLDQYWAMLAKLGTVDVLTVPATIQTHRGTYREEPGGAVVDLPGTLLLGLQANAPEPDGLIEATATFQRHIDPATGLLVPS